MLALSSLFFSSGKTGSKPSKNPPSSENQNTMSAQTNSEGSVVVSVTPQNVDEDKKTWSFKIALDTHEGSLDEDLAKNAVLVSSEGEEVFPLEWQGDPAGGHHRIGLLNFKSFIQNSNSVTLILKNIGGVPQRRFIW